MTIKSADGTTHDVTGIGTGGTALGLGIAGTALGLLNGGGNLLNWGNGRQYMGEHWTREEVKNAMQGMNIPSDVNDCDMWVAANAMWHDMHRKFNDSQILDITCLFFFKDEDYDGHDKIWKYMSIR